MRAMKNRDMRRRGGALGATLCRNCWPALMPSRLRAVVQRQLANNGKGANATRGAGDTPVIAAPASELQRPTAALPEPRCSRRRSSKRDDGGGDGDVWPGGCGPHGPGLLHLVPGSTHTGGGGGVPACPALAGVAVVASYHVGAVNGGSGGGGGGGGGDWGPPGSGRGGVSARRGGSNHRPVPVPRASGSPCDSDSGGGGDGGAEGPTQASGRRSAAERAAEGVGPATPSSSGGEAGTDDDPPASPGLGAALALLAFYRGVLSPLLPSTCRFLPTCSVYSIESYKKFGVARGTVLTAWRLLRCNPWGGRGYDPPSWPPVGLGAVYRLPYMAEVSVVVGVAAAAWFVQSTLESLMR